MKIKRLNVIIDSTKEEMLIQKKKIKEIEDLIDGNVCLQHADRQFIRYDYVTILASSTLTGPKKERLIFLFCDLFLMT